MCVCVHACMCVSSLVQQRCLHTLDVITDSADDSDVWQDVWSLHSHAPCTHPTISCFLIWTHVMFSCKVCMHHKLTHSMQAHTHTYTHSHTQIYAHLIYKAEIVCLSVCVFAIRARVSRSGAVKLAVAAGNTRGQVIAGLTAPVLWLAESYPSISAFFFADDGHFLIIFPVYIRFPLI